MTVTGVYGVVVRVTGPDPTQAKVKGRAFFLTDNGTTVISCSGTLVIYANQQNKIGAKVKIITSAASISSFFALEPSHEDHSSMHATSAPTTTVASVADQAQNKNMQLVPGTRIEVCIEATSDRSPNWVPVSLSRVISLNHASSVAARTFGIRDPANRGTSLCSIAILSCPVDAVPHTLLASASLPSHTSLVADRPLKVCDALTVISAPFGLVSPELLLNSVTTGIVCSRLPLSGDHVYNSNTNNRSTDLTQARIKMDALIVTDARCLHGSEGGPVFNASRQWVGIVAPLMKKFNNDLVELYVVIPVSLFHDGILDSFGRIDPSGHVPSENKLLPYSGMVGIRNSVINNSTAHVISATNDQQQQQQIQIQKHSLSSGYNQPTIDALSAALSGIALVQVGRTWGSAFLVSPQGFLLTCAHVLKPYMAQTNSVAGTESDDDIPNYEEWFCTEKVWVSFRDLEHTVRRIPQVEEVGEAQPRQLLARVIFCARGPVDVALLQVDPESLSLRQSAIHVHDEQNTTSIGKARQSISKIHDKQFELQQNISRTKGRPIEFDEANSSVDDKSYELGKTVFALGHGLISPDNYLGATVTRGSLSKIIHHAGGPALIQSCASVFHGHSGGLLVDERGRALGILTINGERNNGSSIPRLNFSIALHMLRPLLDGINTGDIETMRRAGKSVDVQDATIESLLNLESVDHGINDNDAARAAPADMLSGTRFGEFLTELNAGKFDSLRRRSKL